MDFKALASLLDPTLQDAGLRSHEVLPDLRRQEIRSREIIAELRRQDLRSREIIAELRRQKLRPRKASARLRRPPSFERIRPSLVHERGRTGSHEQSSRPRPRSGSRSVNSSRSSRDSFVNVIDSRQLLGRNMQQQEARDISVLDERSSKVSGLGSSGQATRTHTSGHNNRKKQPSDGSNRSGRLEAPSRVSQGTLAAYKERKAEHQRTEGSPGNVREGTLKTTADVDRATVYIRGWKETNDEGTEESPGSPHENDCNPTSSPPIRALDMYQGNKLRDETPERLRKTYHREGSNVTSMSQGGTSVTRKGKEETDEATEQLPRRYEIDTVDTTDSRTGALVIGRGEEPEDTSAEELRDTSAEEPQDASAGELAKQVGRGITERDTNLVDFGEMSSDNRGGDLTGKSINQGVPRGVSLPLSEDAPCQSDFGKTDLSLESDLDELSDKSLRAKRERRSSISDVKKSFSNNDITIRRAERRISSRSRSDRPDGDNSLWSDNEASRKLSQRKGATREHTRRRTTAGHQRRTGRKSNDHTYMDRNTPRLEGSDAHRAPGADSTLAGSSQLLRVNRSPADMGMRTLLVYRAVLFATLCALAADTSCVYETELGRRIVQVL